MTTPRLAGEEGSTATLAVATPLMLTLLLLIVHAALYLHAATVVHAAARDGARAARGETGTADAGTARAHAVLDSLPDDLLGDRRVTASRTTTTAQVQVTARIAGPVPFLAPPLTATVTSPVERLTGVEDRR
jgi:Flp pilus assembly protein TadG